MKTKREGDRERENPKWAMMLISKLKKKPSSIMGCFDHTLTLLRWPLSLL